MNPISFSADEHGQIILIMAITLVAVILTVSTMIYITATQHLFFNYNPTREIILTIDSDFERVLTRILANATQLYNFTSIKTEEGYERNAMEVAREVANLTFSYWVLSTQAAHAGKGLSIETDFIDETVQEQGKKIRLKIEDGGTIFNDELTYQERKLEQKLFKLWWYRPNSISAIGADLSIDSTIGVIGWKSRHIVFLNFTITAIRSVRSDDAVYVDVSVFMEPVDHPKPVNDLRAENFEVYVFDPTVTLGPGKFWWKRMPVDRLELTYNGGGNYTVKINSPLENPGSSNAEDFWDFYFSFILIRVKDNRGILVEAYSYSGVEYTITERAVENYYPNNPYKTRETYIFELLPNGTLSWNFRNLETSNPRPPVPLPPVKQIRLQATTNGPGSEFREITLYQVERWDDRYLWPCEEKFIEGYARIRNGSKIVFQLNYPPGVREQKVRLIWFDDCDAEMPHRDFRLEYREGIQVAFTKHYTLMLVVDRELANQYYHHIDWTMSLLHKDAPRDIGALTTYLGGIDYILLGYDAYRSGNTYFIPYKIPEDDWTVLPKDDDGDGVVYAIVRAVAFRKTNRVVSSMENAPGEFRDELYHEAMIQIPYDASYFLYYINASWFKDVDIQYSYLVFGGIIGGRIEDPYQQVVEKYKWGSLLTPNGIVVNGTFNNLEGYIPHRGYVLGTQIGDGSYSHWFALYNESFGAAIFASEQMIQTLDKYGKTYKKGGRETDQVFVWTRGSGASRFMEYDAITVEVNTPTKINRYQTPKIEFKAAGFLLEGGVQEGDKFNNDGMWNDGGGDFARPFTRVGDPQATVSGPGELRLEKRAFIWDDFSINPIGSSMTVTSGTWRWEQDAAGNGYLRVDANGPSDGWGGMCVAYYPSGTYPMPSGRTIYVLVKERHSITANGQHVGLLMIENQNRFYSFEYYHAGTNTQRIRIIRYFNNWQNPSSVSLSLSDNVWRTFMGSRTVNNGLMNFRVAELGISVSATNTQINVGQFGVGVRVENSGTSMTAMFDDFIACVDSDPRYVTINDVNPGWRIEIKDQNGNTVFSSVATGRKVVIDVLSRPIIRNGRIEVYDYAGNLMNPGTTDFDAIVGGDIYRFRSSKTFLNAVDQCMMYYRMFLDSYAPVYEIRILYSPLS
ncbi:MAG: hypothetical protein ACUVQ0_04050 [Thermoproteota archaeon]